MSKKTRQSKVAPQAKKVTVTRRVIRSKRPVKRVFYKDEEKTWFKEALLNVADSASQAEPVPQTAPPLPREQLIISAKDLICTDRNYSYGDPMDNFVAVATLKEVFWKAMQRSKNTPDWRAEIHFQNSAFGHAIDMILLNLARLATSPKSVYEKDRFLDLIGYAALAGEIVERLRSEKP